MIINGISKLGLWMHVKGIRYEKNDIIYGYRDNGSYCLAVVRDDFTATDSFENDLNSCGGYANQTSGDNNGDTGATLQDLINWLQNSGVLRYYKISGNTWKLTTTMTPTQHPLYPGLYDVRTENGGPVGFVASNGYTVLRVYESENGLLYELINFMLGTFYTRIYRYDTQEYEPWVEMTGSAAAESLLKIGQMIEYSEVLTEKLQETTQMVSDLYRYTAYSIDDHFDSATRRVSLFPNLDDLNAIGYIVNLSTTIDNEDNSFKKQWTIKILRSDLKDHIYDEYGSQLLLEEGQYSLYVPEKVDLLSIFAI